MTPRKNPFENIVGKGENAGNQHIVLFKQCFLPYQRQKSSLELHLFCFLQLLLIWSHPKFGCLKKRVNKKVQNLNELFTKNHLLDFIAPIQSIYRWEIKYYHNDKFYHWKGRKHCGKRRIIPFPSRWLNSQLCGKDITLYSLPNEKILDWSKLNASEDNKLTLYSIDTHFD